MSYKIISDILKKSRVPSFVLIFGTEDYLIDDAVKNIKKKYIDENYESMNYIEFEKIENNFVDFYEFVTTYPFISEKKLCVIKEAIFLTSTGSLNKNDEEKFNKILDEGSDSCIKVFLLKDKKPDSRKKIVKKFKDNNAIFEINKLNESELSKYIADRFKSNNLNINLHLANYIANNSGYLEYESTVNLYHINNEIDKISSFKTVYKDVLMEDVDSLLIKSSESNIFKLIDNICDGNKEQAFGILDDMLLNNTPEQVIIHMLVRQYRMLYQYVILSNKGYNFNEIMSKMKLKNFVANKLSKQARSLNSEKIEYYLEKMLEIDKKIKTGEIESRIGLELITNGIIK
ncbi:DNA polymerase III subunit delta [Sedimentibacter sp.]|uniref:DNA polymerase III subunit delta n=1 Tax=Sedimentibacter sp. TaxID=1960295 RepID=UPI0028AE16AA|nr:DNA polymerase III subunit delta [Sedimentibacter sp.]